MKVAIRRRRVSIFTFAYSRLRRSTLTTPPSTVSFRQKNAQGPGLKAINYRLRGGAESVRGAGNDPDRIMRCRRAGAISGSPLCHIVNEPWRNFTATWDLLKGNPAMTTIERPPTPRPPPAMTLINRKQLLGMVPMSERTILDMEKRGEFPRRFAVAKRLVAWDLREIESWISARKAAAVQLPAPAAPAIARTSDQSCPPNPEA